MATGFLKICIAHSPEESNRSEVEMGCGLRTTDAWREGAIWSSYNVLRGPASLAFFVSPKVHAHRSCEQNKEKGGFVARNGYVTTSTTKTSTPLMVTLTSQWSLTGSVRAPTKRPLAGTVPEALGPATPASFAVVILTVFPTGAVTKTPPSVAEYPW